MEVSCFRLSLGFFLAYGVFVALTVWEMFAPTPCRGGRCFRPILTSDHRIDLVASVDGEVLCEGQPLAAGRDVPPGFVAA